MGPLGASFDSEAGSLMMTVRVGCRDLLGTVRIREEMRETEAAVGLGLVVLADALPLLPWSSRLRLGDEVRARTLNSPLGCVPPLLPAALDKTRKKATKRNGITTGHTVSPIMTRLSARGKIGMAVRKR